MTRQSLKDNPQALSDCFIDRFGSVQNATLSIVHVTISESRKYWAAKIAAMSWVVEFPESVDLKYKSPSDDGFKTVFDYYKKKFPNPGAIDYHFSDDDLKIRFRTDALEQIIMETAESQITCFNQDPKEYLMGYIGIELHDFKQRIITVPINDQHSLQPLSTKLFTPKDKKLVLSYPIAYSQLAQETRNDRPGLHMKFPHSQLPIKKIFRYYLLKFKGPVPCSSSDLPHEELEAIFFYSDILVTKIIPMLTGVTELTIPKITITAAAHSGGVPSSSATSMSGLFQATPMPPVDLQTALSDAIRAQIKASPQSFDFSTQKSLEEFIQHAATDLIAKRGFLQQLQVLQKAWVHQPPTPTAP